MTIFPGISRNYGHFVNHNWPQFLFPRICENAKIADIHNLRPLGHHSYIWATLSRVFSVFTSK